MNAVLEARMPFSMILGPPPSVAVLPLARAPGVKVASCVKSRPFKGRSTTFFWPTTCPTAPDSDCKSGAASVTVTDSVIAPTSSAKSILATWSTSSLMAGRAIDLNPASSTFIA